MVELNHRDRTIKVKLVYYGPPVGGKTTNLQILHRCADAKRRGALISINSAQDRTILFDLLPLKTPGFRGFDLRLQVLAVPGQAMYSAKLNLIATDSTDFLLDTFLILGGYVLYESFSKLYNAEIPEPSLLGIMIALASTIVMPLLFYLKHSTGNDLGSKSLIADSKETLSCFFLSIASSWM